ncbi:SpoIIAA-like protein [Agitococcus lubricus]|uniref:SpoIIAA-like protein n=2 Tax=Agitococcus lubricus TaxID=1077255 RepID=A0A2T5J3S1_9GAMM|nr:SpoIIAA-like protein [Agitococcus lubricus]
MTVTVDFEANQLLVLRGSGILTHEEFTQSKQAVAALLKQHGKLAIMIVIEEDFSQLQELADWHDTELDAFIQQHVTSLAILGSEKWSAAAQLFFLSGLVAFPIKYFPLAHEPLARAWLMP